MNVGYHNTAVVWDCADNLIQKIVAAARIRIIPSSLPKDSSKHQLPPLYAGQPISALLSVTTSFHWGETQKNSDRRYKMRFDIEEMVKEWLVSGQKLGDFVATVSTQTNWLESWLTLRIGWLHTYRPYYINRLTPRGTQITESRCDPSSRGRRANDGIHGYT